MRTVVIVAMALFLASVTTAFALEGVAFMDYKRVSAESDALKEIRTILDAKFGDQKNALEKEREGIDKDLAKFQDKEPTKEQAEDLRKREREFADKVQAFMRLFQADERRYSGELDMAVNRAAKELASRKGLSMILDVAGAFYYDPKMDVTEEMIGETNIQWKKMKPESDAKK